MERRITGSADVMEAQQGEGAFPGSLSTGRAPALGLNSISAVGASALADLVSQAAASWTHSKPPTVCVHALYNLLFCILYISTSISVSTLSPNWLDVKQTVSISCVHKLPRELLCMICAFQGSGDLLQRQGAQGQGAPCSACTCLARGHMAVSATTFVNSSSQANYAGCTSGCA